MYWSKFKENTFKICVFHCLQLLLLLLLSRFSRVRLCNPIEAAHQAPPSLGFSRQEYWSGLPLFANFISKG